MESDGKAWGFVLFFFFLPGLFALPELIAGEEGLSGVPRASAGILALISQTHGPSVNSSGAGSRGGGMPQSPSSALMSWCGPPEHPRVLTESSAHACPWQPHIHMVTQLDWLSRGKRAQSWEICGTAWPNPTALPQAATPDQSAQCAPAPAVHGYRRHHASTAALRLETRRNFL